MNASPASNMDVKRRNRANTLRCILTCERISQTELCQRLALSWPTILQNVKELTELGLAREVGLYESTGGRKARAYAPVTDARLAVAVNNLHMSFDCDVIAGGYVGAFLEEFGGALREMLEERNTFQRDASYLRFCRYKLEASAVGAALTRVERFIRTL